MDKRISKEMITAVTEIKDVNEFMDNAVSIVNLKMKTFKRFWKKTIRFQG